ncbi:hypothetical protein BCR43DRAFT_496776 [Syncephalastrum racemosum]|uniref:Uncharacterized protein n=1 Tax=Syncephalastrum racemosum TaxID=13706 RepID=A0A1X2H4K5_SYNRA|nr:hypothetical protein BCR43DRAFT_496776 [Syncephalastrum racemosum]
MCASHGPFDQKNQVNFLFNAMHLLLTFYIKHVLAERRKACLFHSHDESKITK